MVDRRKFLQRAGIGGGVAGALWVAPSVVGFSTAFAGPSCAQTGTWDWSSFAVGSDPGSITLGAVGPYPAVTVTKTVTPIGGVTPGANTQQVVNTPAPLGGVGGSGYRLSFQPPNSTNTSGYDLTFTFSTTVYNLKFTISDIDAAAYIDHVWVTAPTGFSAVPAPEVTGAGSAASPWIGTATVADNTSGASVPITFATATAFTIHYRGDAVNHLVQQHIYLLNLTWCR